MNYDAEINVAQLPCPIPVMRTHSKLKSMEPGVLKIIGISCDLSKYIKEACATDMFTLLEKTSEGMYRIYYVEKH